MSEDINQANQTSVQTTIKEAAAVTRLPINSKDKIIYQIIQGNKTKEVNFEEFEKHFLKTREKEELSDYKKDGHIYTFNCETSKLTIEIPEREIQVPHKTFSNSTVFFDSQTRFSSNYLPTNGSSSSDLPTNGSSSSSRSKIHL